MATNRPRDTEANEREGYGYEDDERPNRDTDDWLELIGPEDLDRDRVVENLEQYGFDIMDDDEELSLETGEGFLPAYPNGAYQDIEEVGDRIYATPVDADDNLSARPVEDEVLDDLSGDGEDDGTTPP